MDKKKDFLTTTDVANMCRVSQQTVVSWNDRGKLPDIHGNGRLTGATRRFREHDVLLFLACSHPVKDRHCFPVLLEDGKHRVLIIDNTCADDSEPAVAETIRSCGFPVEYVRSSFEAGMVVFKSLPSIVVVNTESDRVEVGPIHAATNGAKIKPLPLVKVVAITSDGKKNVFAPISDAVITDTGSSENVRAALEAAISS
jgi:hypothetical protein